MSRVNSTLAGAPPPPSILLGCKVLAWRRKDEKSCDSHPQIFKGPACGWMIWPVQLCSRDKTRTNKKSSVMWRNSSESLWAMTQVPSEAVNLRRGSGKVWTPPARRREPWLGRDAKQGSLQCPSNANVLVLIIWPAVLTMVSSPFSGRFPPHCFPFTAPWITSSTRQGQKMHPGSPLQSCESKPRNRSQIHSTRRDGCRWTSFLSPSSAPSSFLICPGLSSFYSLSLFLTPWVLLLVSLSFNLLLPLEKGQSFTALLLYLFPTSSRVCFPLQLGILKGDLPWG